MMPPRCWSSTGQPANPPTSSRGPSAAHRLRSQRYRSHLLRLTADPDGRTVRLTGRSWNRHVPTKRSFVADCDTALARPRRRRQSSARYRFCCSAPARDNALEARRRTEAGSRLGETSPASLSSARRFFQRQASGQHADHRRAEAAINSQSDAPSSGQLIPSPRRIPPAAQQPIPLTAAQDVVEDHLAGRLSMQNADLVGGPARAKRTTRHRFQDRKLDYTKRLDRLHSSSLRRHPAHPERLGEWRSPRNPGLAHEPRDSRRMPTTPTGGRARDPEFSEDDECGSREPFRGVGASPTDCLAGRVRNRTRAVR